VQSHHHQGAHYGCLQKLQLLKFPIKIHRCVVMWLHICSNITTHRCILIGYFNNCNSSKHE
jgi:hypothetical protein